MKINISKVSKLANIILTDEEKTTFEQQLSEILNYIEKLNELDTKDILPTSQVTDLENVIREDKTKPSLEQENVLSNTKSKHNGFFKTKAVLSELL
ncbi:MAG: Asp-tRNA(Asn)/Glu-tRNA(Gln) amidotransferase subunit GatC [Patescibacteria group bacterium]|nr:Asp-tRNA(Asn)/Glu-tRNA(Gln) amidotransferase subunit GatC [Patescibacteria group bacterium]